jgi:hypothetical protein
MVHAAVKGIFLQLILSLPTSKIFASIYINPDKRTRDINKPTKVTCNFILSISYYQEHLDKTYYVVYYHKNISKFSKSIVFLILFYIKKKTSN